MKQFKTRQEEHLIPTVVNVVDSPYSLYSVCYDTFKEYFVKEGYDTFEKWENFLKNDYCDVDSHWIDDIADFYNLIWTHVDPDDGACKGNDYFLIYTREQD
jgi:hypothetical protein